MAVGHSLRQTAGIIQPRTAFIGRHEKQHPQDQHFRPINGGVIWADRHAGHSFTLQSVVRSRRSPSSQNAEQDPVPVRLVLEQPVIRAEGLAMESYLDTGDRANFEGDATIRRFPDFAARPAPDAAMLWETKGATPLVPAGGDAGSGTSHCYAKSDAAKSPV